MGKRFEIALSFPGERRDYVCQVAEYLADKLGGREKVLYDEYYKGEFARPNLGVYLPKLYNEESELVVAILDEHYASKKWTGLEWRAIFERLMNKDDEAIMLIRFDWTRIDGLWDQDGCIFAPDHTLEQVCEFILQRLAHLRGAPTTASPPPAPALRGNLPSRNPAFVGRAGELSQLDDVLASSKLKVLGSVHGLGGLGKTALALEYAYSRAARFPGGAWQLSCEGLVDPLAPVLALADTTALGLTLTDEERRKSEVVLARVMAALQAPGRALLILDNVDKPEFLGTPTLATLRAAPNLSLLLTTRLGEAELRPRPGEAVTFVAVDELPEAEAVELLGKYRPFANEEDRQAALEIVRLQARYTLAVEVSAAFLREYPEVSYSDFAARLRAEGLDGLEGAGKEAEPQRIAYATKSLSAALRPTWERLDEPSRIALSYAALLPPDCIALPWVRELLAKHEPSFGAEPTPGYPDLWADLLKHLISQHLLVRLSDGHCVRMHRLLGQVIENWMGRQTLALYEAEALKFAQVRSKFLEERWHQREDQWEIDPLVAYAVLVCEYPEKDSAWLANSAAFGLYTLGRWSEAEELYFRSLEINKTVYGPEHSEVATNLNNLAVLFQVTNRRDKAESFLRRALEIDEASLGSDHPLVAARLSNLAGLLQTLGRVSEAEPLMQHASKIVERYYGSEHTEFAYSLINLAGILKAMNRLDEAEPLMRRARTILETNLGPDHPGIVNILNNLAALLIETGRLVEAEPLIRHALAISEASFGPSHPTVTNLVSTLASLLQKTNHLDAAESLMRRALSDGEACFGKDHPKVAIRLNNLAMLLHDANRIEEAEPLQRRALAIDEASYGPEHPNVATRLSNLALLLLETNRQEEAGGLFQRALEILARASASCGYALPNLSSAANNFYEFLLKSGRNKPQAKEEVNAVIQGACSGMESCWSI